MSGGFGEERELFIDVPSPKSLWAVSTTSIPIIKDAWPQSCRSSKNCAVLLSSTKKQEEHRHSDNAAMSQLFRAWTQLVHDCTKSTCPKSFPGSVLQRTLLICLGELEQNLSQKISELDIPKLWEVQMILPGPKIPNPIFCEFWIWRSSQSCTSWIRPIFNMQ